MAKVTKQTEQYIIDNYKLIGMVKLSEELDLDQKTIYRYGLKWGLTETRPVAKWIKINCPICNKEFYRTENYLKNNEKRNRKTLCSKVCVGRKKEKDSLAEQAYQLALSGVKNKEIAKTMNKPIGTITNWLNKKKFRRTWGMGISYPAQRNKLRKQYKSCIICGFERIIEIAHIIPASKGGLLTEKNTLGLCPNHHYLFDHNKLTPEEFDKIKLKIEENKNV